MRPSCPPLGLLHHRQLLLQYQQLLLRPPLGLRSSRKPPTGVEAEVEAAEAMVEAAVYHENRRRVGRNAEGEDGAVIGDQDPDHPADPNPAMMTGSAAAASPEGSKRVTEGKRKTAVPGRRRHHHPRPVIRPIGTIPSVTLKADRVPWWPIATASSRMWALGPLDA